MVDEFDRAGVVAAAAVAEHAAERVVELVDVGAMEPAVVGDVPFELGRHLVHVAESSSACGLRDPDLVAVEVAERVGGQALRR